MNRRSFFRRAAGFVAGLLGVPAAAPLLSQTTRNATFLRFEDDTVSPVLDIKWGEFKAYTLRGEWVKGANRGS